MGKHKCDCPLHQGRCKFAISMSEILFQKAKEKFPVLEWKGVKKICLKCKKIILETQPQRKIRKRGPKTKASNFHPTDLQETSGKIYFSYDAFY